MQTRSATVTTAVLLFSGAVLANVAFAGLGAVFNYPDILQAPTAEIFDKFSAHRGIITLWFLLLALGAGLLAPIAVLLARLFPGCVSRLTMWTGISAAIVQVTGLLRWPLLVPTFISSGDAATFELVHKILGTLIGETLGYCFTAVWTILLMKEIGNIAGRWFTWLGYVSAGLILLGILVPLGVPGTDAANFVGYVLWSFWLIAFAVVLLRRGEIE
jgi:hypothetical protein